MLGLYGLMHRNLGSVKTHVILNDWISTAVRKIGLEQRKHMLIAHDGKIPHLTSVYIQSYKITHLR